MQSGGSRWWRWCRYQAEGRITMTKPRIMTLLICLSLSRGVGDDDEDVSLSSGVENNDEEDWNQDLIYSLGRGWERWNDLDGNWDWDTWNDGWKYYHWEGPHKSLTLLNSIASIPLDWSMPPLLLLLLSSQVVFFWFGALPVSVLLMLMFEREMYHVRLCCVLAHV